jgi:hypothetical protein|tara:strand:+ start:36 stop:272 length:237 start_codon:yes stop_codon:yes gene_type:complete
LVVVEEEVLIVVRIKMVALVALVEVLLIMITEDDQLLVLELLVKVTLEVELQTAAMILEIQVVAVVLVRLEQVVQVLL